MASVPAVAGPRSRPRPPPTGPSASVKRKEPRLPRAKGQQRHVSERQVGKKSEVIPEVTDEAGEEEFEIDWELPADNDEEVEVEGWLDRLKSEEAEEAEQTWEAVVREGGGAEVEVSPASARKPRVVLTRTWVYEHLRALDDIDEPVLERIVFLEV